MTKRKHGNNMFIYVVLPLLPSVTKLIFITEPTIWQSLEAPQQTKEDKQTVPEVKVNTNGNEQQNDQPHVKKKKLNKQERKEARKQKNGNATNNAENTLAQEPEEAVAGKKKKKDRKRKRGCEEDGNEEQNGLNAENVTSRKKTKGKSDIFLKAF